MPRLLTTGTFLVAIVALATGCATSNYGPLPDVVRLLDSGGKPVVGATVLPVQEILASFEMYYSPAEKIRRRSDINGRARIDLTRHLSQESGTYLFDVSKEGYRRVVVEIAPKDFSGTISVDFVPAETPPNKSPEATPSARTPAADAPVAPAVGRASS
jgi:hypothetical protein